MSLQAWYPLNGNIQNYGIGNLNPIATTTPAYVAPGKIGAQAMTTGGIKWTAAQAASVLNNDAVSFSFWIKAVGTGSGQIFGTSGMGANNNRKFAIFAYPTGNDLHLSWMNDAADTTFIGAVWSGVFPSNVWTHCCITYQNPTVKIYINGVLKDTKTGISTSSSFAYETQVIHNSANRYLNDFRVYNHCLSVKEVKLLSQGLIAHYKLAAGGNNNLLTNTCNPSSTTGLASVPSTCSIAYDDIVGRNVFQSTTTGTTETFIYSTRTPQVSQSTQYTFSCDVWVNDYVKSIQTFWLSDTIANQKTGSGYVNVTSYDQTIPIRNQWFHLSWTFTTKADDYTGYIRFDNNGSSVSGTAAIVKLTNLKLEKGSVESPYTPAASELGFSVGDDTGGYKYNGTVSGNIALSAATGGRNGVVANFTGSEYIACGRGPMVRDELTVNWWGYMDDWSLYGTVPMRALSCTEGGGWNFEPSSSKMAFACGTGESSNTYKSVVSTITFSSLNSGWHMFTGSWNGLASKIYIDGVLSNTNTAYTTKTPLFYHSSNGIFIGAEAGGSISAPAGTYFTGKLSDVRIYCTALSDADILALYQVAASNAKNGGLFGYNFNEQIADFKVHKNGVITAGDFSERGPLINTKFTTLSDNSAWARVFYHNNCGGTVLFTSVAEVLNTDSDNKYSCLYLLDQLKAVDGKYEFMLTYPADLPDKFNRWKQTNNPCKEYLTLTSSGNENAAGYEAIDIDWVSNYWGGLTRQSSSESALSNCYLSGSTGHSNWFYAIGASSSWNSAIPGPSAAVSEVELWVRIDTLPLNTKLSILKERYVQTSLLQEI